MGIYYVRDRLPEYDAAADYIDELETEIANKRLERWLRQRVERC